nr:unnamed protein product [Callosobruchus analis]
MAKPLGLT